MWIIRYDYAASAYNFILTIDKFVVGVKIWSRNLILPADFMDVLFFMYIFSLPSLFGFKDLTNLEVTIIPTYDTDVLGYWVAENEELLSQLKIDLAPSASRCTINLQVHFTVIYIKTKIFYNSYIFALGLTKTSDTVQYYSPFISVCYCTIRCRKTIWIWKKIVLNHSWI